MTTLLTVPSEKLLKATTDLYLKGLLEEGNVAITRGYALAIGVLPTRFLSLPQGKLEYLMYVLGKTATAAVSATVTGGDHHYLIEVSDPSRTVMASANDGRSSNSIVTTEKAVKIASTTANGEDDNITTSVPLSTVTTTIVSSAVSVNADPSIKAPTSAAVPIIVVEDKVEAFKQRYLAKQQAAAAAAIKLQQEQKQKKSSSAAVAENVASSSSNKNGHSDTSNTTNTDKSSIKKATTIITPLTASQQDIETRVNIVNALPEILEKLEPSDVIDSYSYHNNNRISSVSNNDSKNSDGVQGTTDKATTSSKSNNNNLDDVILTAIRILLQLCNDYTVDNRGDVGSWVRQAALLAMERVFYLSFRRLSFRVGGDNGNNNAVVNGSDNPTLISSSDSIRISNNGQYIMTSYGDAYVVNADSQSSIAPQQQQPQVTQPVLTNVLFSWMSGGYTTAVNNHSKISQQIDDNEEDEEEDKDSYNDDSKNGSASSSSKKIDTDMTILSNGEADITQDTQQQPQQQVNENKNQIMSMLSYRNHLHLSNHQNNSDDVAYNKTDTYRDENDKYNATAAGIIPDTMVTTANISCVHTQRHEKRVSEIKQLLTHFIGHLLKQLGEKLDVMRSVAGQVLCRFTRLSFSFSSSLLVPLPSFSSSSPSRSISVIDLLIQSLLPSEMRLIQSVLLLSSSIPTKASVDWSSPHIVYPFLIALLKQLYQDYCSSLNRNQNGEGKLSSSSSQPVVGAVAGTDSHEQINDPPSSTMLSTSSLSEDGCFMYYMENVLAGIIISIGCINEKISKVSKKCFLDMLISICENEKTSNSVIINGCNNGCGGFMIVILTSLVKIMKVHSNIDRAIIPLLKTFNAIFQQGIITVILNNNGENCNKSDNTITAIDGISDDSNNSIVVYNELIELITTLLHLIKTEMNTTSDIVKIKLCCDLFIMYLLLPSQLLRINAMKILLVLLGHKFANIRKYVAEILYLHILSDNYMIVSSSSSSQNHHHSYYTSQSKNIIRDNSVDVNVVMSRETNNDILNITTMKSSVDDHHQHISPHQQSSPYVPCGFVSTTDEYNQILTLLTTTSWEDSTAQARQVRSMLCQLMKIKLTQNTVLSTSVKNDNNINTADGENNQRNDSSNNRNAAAIALANDESMSYSSLVREAGF